MSDFDTNSTQTFSEKTTVVYAVVKENIMPSTYLHWSMIELCGLRHVSTYIYVFQHFDCKIQRCLDGWCGNLHL